jgi:tight adherence protein C
MKSLLSLKQLLDDRRLTRLQEYVSKMSAKMSVVMMLFLFPALLIVLAGPGFTAISRAFAN